MKIIKPGIQKGSHWWAGLVFKCTNCTCEYTLDDQDHKIATIRKLNDMLLQCVCKCPECEYPNQVTHFTGVD